MPWLKKASKPGRYVQNSSAITMAWQHAASMVGHGDVTNGSLSFAGAVDYAAPAISSSRSQHRMRAVGSGSDGNNRLPIQSGAI
jgi:hypothetical protein